MQRKLDKNFTLTLVDVNGVRGNARGAVNGTHVMVGQVDWSGAEPEHTDNAHLVFDAGPTITMSGNAWREIESSGALEGFIRLFLLDRAKAEKVIELAAEAGRPYYKAILTRDAGTESCTAYTTTNEDEETILEEENAAYIQWEANDNFTDRAYLGGGEDDVEESTLDDIVSELLHDAEREAQKTASHRAYELTQRLAKLLSDGDRDADGNIFKPNDGFEDSHLMLTRFIGEAREIVALNPK